MEESKRMDYNVENISKLMGQEEFGIHIALLDGGLDESGMSKMSVVVESDLNAGTVKSIFAELLRQYEELNNN